MAITVNNFKCSRCLSNGTVNNTGTYMMASIDFTSDTYATYRIEYKLDSASTWTTLYTDNVYYYNGTYQSSTAIFNYDYSYQVRLSIDNDASESTIETSFVPTGFTLIDFHSGGKGIAIGKTSDRANSMQVGIGMYDSFDKIIGNGLAVYESEGSTNINTSLDELILASVSALGGFYFIRQMFGSTKSTSTQRVQIAYPYDSDGSNYRRYHNGSYWSAWYQIPTITIGGTSNIWTYREYSDGTAECFAKISITGADCVSTLGNWYRTAQLYDAYQYAYPVAFSGAPVVEMTFQTTNSNGGLLWLFSQNSTQAQQYLPSGYIIRPTTATGINGNINITARGNI